MNVVAILMLLYFVQITQPIPDFQVNSEDYPGQFRQDLSAIATYNSGGVVVWRDLRVPSYSIKVFGVRLDSVGDTIGANFIITDDTTGFCYPPDVGCDSQGNFTVVWRQHDQTYCRRFQNDGTPVGPPFIVNDVTSTCCNPEVAVDSSWRTVVIWLDNRQADFHLYGQIYDSEGSLVDTNFLISDSSQNMLSICDVSFGVNKEFYVVWPFASDIWCQKFDSLGNKMGGDFRVWNDTLNIGEDYPAIKCDNNGNFLITWSSQGNILCRIFDTTATPLTDVITLNDPSITHSERPKVTSVHDSLWFVVWEDNFLNIYLQRLSEIGQLIGDNIQVNLPAGQWSRFPDVGISSNNIIITWTRRTYQFLWDIMTQVVSDDGNLVGQNKIITDDTGGALQFFPSVVADTAGYFFIIWDDTRNPEFPCIEQYGKRFDAQGNPLSEDFKINENIDAQTSAIGLNNLGLYVTVWARVYSDSNHQIYGQRFDRNGTPLGPNFQISLAPGNTYPYFPRIAALSNDHFVVVWQEPRTNSECVYGRLLDPLGIPYGGEFMTYFDSTASNLAWSIVDEGNARFILGMSCNNDTGRVAIQEFDYNANPLSASIILNEYPIGDYVIVSGAKGIDRYLFVWYDSTRAHIYGQLVNDSLQKIGDNFLVTDDTIPYKEFPSVVSNDDGQFFVVWDDSRNGNFDIYGQFFDSMGNKIGDNFRVDNDTTDAQQGMPSCYSENDLIYIVWTDTRIPEHGYDVYCGVMEWEVPGVSEGKITDVHGEIIVAPNPFVKNLNIIIPGGQMNMDITIYDVMGRMVCNFSFKQSKDQLIKIINWDGKDTQGRKLPTGIYFLRFEASDFKETRKVILLK